MSLQNQDKPGQGLTRGQRRVLLWLPLVALWMVLYLISVSPETGGRDWSSLIMMCVAAAVVYMIVWIGLGKLTAAGKKEPESTPEKIAHAGSRAAAIYGKPVRPEPPSPGPDAGAEPQDDAPSEGPGTPLG